MDWYFLLSEKHVELPKVIEVAQKKFGGEFNDRLFLSQLVSFEDIYDMPVDFLRNPISRQEIQTALDDQVRSFQL